NERARLVAQLSDAPDSNRSEPFRMMVGEETYLALMGRLEDLQGEAQGFYLIQFSLDQAIQFLTTIEQMLLLIGAGVLFTAALFSFAGVRQITRPVQALVEGTRRLAAGRLEHRIPVSSSDEIGELAGSFNDMAGSLTQSRDALEESGRRYRDLFDNAQDIVYTTDLEMRFASVNKAAIEFSGYGLDELLGKSFYDLLTPEDAQRLRKIEERYEPGAHRLPEEVEFLRKNGTRATLEIVSRWVIEGGQPIGVHGIGRDISQRKEREEAAQRFREQLHQAEKLRALGEMAAGVAHNFNNLLTGVMGYAELMKLRDDVPEPVQNNAQKIVESARRCAAIVRRIQTFGRPIDPSQRERVNLNTVIRDTVDITHAKWKSQAEREGKQVRVELELGEIPLVQSVGSAWEEILSNLIFNAVDAMPESGTITLGTRLDGEHVVVFVADTGTGMDEETQRRVFEPFFTTKSPERGTGLGLSTVWGLVQSQGGRVDIESTLGKGTTFFIRVPVADSGEADARVEAGVRVVRALRILVIDDDLMVRDFLPSLLAPHEVDAAENGPEGLTLFRRKQHDLVITDWVMSGMSGLEVAEQVKELSAHTVVVLMTGWETLGTAAENHDAVDLVVTKPFDSVKLNRALQQVAQLREQPVVGGDA
ncbi:MAG: PAS domain S-box protein, partial [bacterium]|nr:PAS domain S-box protein [bacterium]